MIVLNPIVQARKEAQRERYRKWRATAAGREKALKNKRQWDEKNGERRKEYRRQYRQKNELDIRLYSRERNERDAVRRRRKDKRLWADYRITLADYEAMVAKQHGKCAICQDRSIEAVDHCHATGAVRGLLCSSCNKGIGFFGDQPALLTAAIQYLSAIPEPPPPPPVSGMEEPPPPDQTSSPGGGEAPADPQQVPPELQPQ